MTWFKPGAEQLAKTTLVRTRSHAWFEQQPPKLAPGNLRLFPGISAYAICASGLSQQPYTPRCQPQWPSGLMLCNRPARCVSPLTMVWFSGLAIGIQKLSGQGWFCQVTSKYLIHSKLADLSSLLSVYLIPDTRRQSCHGLYRVHFLFLAHIFISSWREFGSPCCLIRNTPDCAIQSINTPLVHPSLWRNSSRPPYGIIRLQVVVPTATRWRTHPRPRHCTARAH